MIDNKVYIGSSILLDYRKRNHFNNLKNNTHNNEHLQNAYNKYGKHNFKWDIIEYISKEDKELLINREEYWISIFQSLDKNLGYNKRTADRYNNGFKGTGHIVKGENNHRAISYKIINIYTNEIYEGRCVAEFARNMNIKGAEGYFLLLNGRINIWNKKFVTEDSLKRLNFFSFINKDGKIIKHFSLSELGKSLNLKPSELTKVHCGRHKQHQGWEKYCVKIKEYILI